MTFFDAVDNAMGVWFGEGFADTVNLNGTDVAAQVVENDTEESGDGMADVLDIEFQAFDYATVSYRTDTAIYGGLTWRYPKTIRSDSRTRLVRFRRNVRPRA